MQAGQTASLKCPFCQRGDVRSKARAVTTVRALYRQGLWSLYRRPVFSRKMWPNNCRLNSYTSYLIR